MRPISDHVQMVDIELFSHWLPRSLEIPVNRKFDCFLAHEWGPQYNESAKFENHEKVKEISILLEKAGLTVWFDERNIETDPDYAIEEGLSQSKVVLIFLTERYFSKVQDFESNCSKEFSSAVLRKPRYIIPVVLEENLSSERTWKHGKVRFHLSALKRCHLYHKANFSERIRELAKWIKDL